jgi:hypothetical protein
MGSSLFTAGGLHADPVQRCGVNSLGELPVNLRQSVLLIEDKVATGTTLEDAEMLAAHARLARGTNGFNEFVQDAIA